MTAAKASSRPAVSVVLVHYRAAELAAEALAAAAADLAAAGLRHELVIVDNGSDERERELLAALPARRLEPGGNPGYATAANLGVEATAGDVVVLMNPDVVVLPGCLPALSAALAGGAAVAGPRFFWDSGRRLLLPPAEARGFADELVSALAAGGGRRAERARARWRRQARRHWTATAPLASHALSGALLAVRRDAWRQAGPFDPGYRLYFEETDWLARARRAGLPALYVPAAEAVHAHAQSARHEPRAEEWFAASARRFRRRRFGRLGAAALERTAGRAARSAHAEIATHVPPARSQGGGVDLAAAAGEAAWRQGPLWVEVSPLARGFPAAGERLAAPPAGGWRLPDDVLARRPGPLAGRLVSARGRELARFDLAGAAAG